MHQNSTIFFVCFHLWVGALAVVDRHVHDAHYRVAVALVGSGCAAGGGDVGVGVADAYAVAEDAVPASSYLTNT